MDMAELLELASEPCLCESYYSYVCYKCRKKSKIPVGAWDAPTNKGYINWDCYGAPKLTERGRGALDILKKDSANGSS